METQVYLKTNQLEKSYGSHRVIEKLSIEVHQGERIALFAPSGAGKTTLIKILCGLESAGCGSFELAGPEPVIIFQEPRLFPFLTVEENILLPLKLKQKELQEEQRLTYRRWMEVCELEKPASLYPYQLSGGMKRKVSLVRGLLGSPRFVIMDEPFQSIDMASRKAIIEHIKDTLPDLTLLMVTHDVEEVAQMANSVMFFTANRLVDPVKLNVKDFAAELANMVFPAGKNLAAFAG